MEGIVAMSLNSNTIKLQTILTTAENLPHGGDVSVVPLNATENKTYTAPSGTAYSPITVQVPIPSFETEELTVTPTESQQIKTPTKDGFSKVTVNAISNTYVGSGVTRQSAKTVTPTKSSQTAVASGVYTSGAVTVGAIPSEYIVPSGSQTKTENGTYDVTSLAQLVVNVSGGGLPSGISAIDYGTYTLASNVTGGSSFTVPHNLGAVPDMFLFYAPSNIAQTYVMMLVFHSTKFAYRGSTYRNICGYHGNSSSNITLSNVTNTYGIKSVTNTTATITTYSSSTSYMWKAGTYEYIAIKF